jgi:hypothetical protein
VDGRLGVLSQIELVKCLRQKAGQDLTTDPGGEKQLFSVGSTYVFNNGY